MFKATIYENLINSLVIEHEVSPPLLAIGNSSEPFHILTPKIGFNIIVTSHSWSSRGWFQRCVPTKIL
jgi:hypothetical protein